MTECRIVVLCSGSGTNLQALIDSNIPNSRIVKVIVNRKTAYAAKRAESCGIPTEYFNAVSGGFTQKGETDETRLKAGRARYDAALVDIILKEKPDLIVLAGFMWILSPQFLEPLQAAGVPVINLHPDHSGRYDGAHAIDRAYADFQAGKLENNRTGIMVHYVVAEVDRGQPILIEEVECREGESLEDLENRIHLLEHRLLPRATAQIVREILNKK
ncbi:phosphoribosylglycinamide formyltransferase [Colletotrichum musicola]|uniref:phosphoribosylglycinamide formyltransferase 1 n=1 Tax=Colletotrichum musicola TaxID=2175873 RepID=A0A8H6IUU8_9PEZI|nr:phosphoribosylglycinamide formyltransferase [Colletotrichum musicola]